MKLKTPFLLIPMLIGEVIFAREKPNILWITIEDTSPEFIGCYGNQEARTPVIDQLAREGVMFTNAFSTGTVCSPSRSTIITGVKTYVAGTGNHRSAYPLPGFIKGFPYYLQEEGYYTTNNSKTDYNIANPEPFTREAWNESSGTAGWWNRKPGQAFFAVFNYMESHQSRTMTESFEWYKENVLDQLPEEDRITEYDFEMPPFYRDTPEMRKHVSRVYNSLKLTDNRIGELLDRLERDHLRDSTIIFFYADHGQGIPRGKSNGIDFGYRVPFIIWFPDMYSHLSPWGTGGAVSDELLSFEDLAPTLVSLAGGVVPEYMKGRILLGENRSRPAGQLFLSTERAGSGIDMVRNVTDGKYFYARNFMPFRPEIGYKRYHEVSEIIQQMRHDLARGDLNPLQESIFEPRSPEFLFDIESDTWETVNLADKPEYRHRLKKMRKQMRKEILGSRDILFLPEYEVGLISKTGTPYEYRLNKKNYPLKTIYRAASLSGYRGKDVTERQVKLLSDTDKIVRYWAITGLRSQSSEDLKSCSEEIKTALNDEYPPVAILAAAIAYQEFADISAEAILKKYCLSEDMNLALLAINLLLYVDNKLPFSEIIQEVYKMEGRSYEIRAASLDFLGILGLVPNTAGYKE